MIFVKGFQQQRAKHFSLRFMTDKYHTIARTTAGIQPRDEVLKKISFLIHFLDFLYEPT